MPIFLIYAKLTRRPHLRLEFQPIFLISLKQFKQRTQLLFLISQAQLQLLSLISSSARWPARFKDSFFSRNSQVQCLGSTLVCLFVPYIAHFVVLFIIIKLSIGLNNQLTIGWFWSHSQINNLPSQPALATNFSSYILKSRPGMNYVCWAPLNLRGSATSLMS